MYPIFSSSLRPASVQKGKGLSEKMAMQIIVKYTFSLVIDTLSIICDAQLEQLGVDLLILQEKRLNPWNLGIRMQNGKCQGKAATTKNFWNISNLVTITKLKDR